MNVNPPLPPQGTFDVLSDDELYTALDAAALYRDAKRLGMPPVLQDEMGRGMPDPCAAPPEAHTLDWQIMQAGSLVTKFYMELCRRDPSLLKMED